MLLCLGALVALGAVGYAAQRAGLVYVELPSARQPTPSSSLTELARQASLRADPIPDVRLVVDKSAVTLSFYAGSLLLKTYPVALGFGGPADKQRRDDGLTPEGEFRIVQRVCRARPRAWDDIWLRLDYPLPEDAERGLRSGLITQQQHQALLAAHERGEIPPRDTALGSGVGIHIGGLVPSNWTQGCIALRREDGLEIGAQVRVGTPVTIVL